MSDHGSPMQRKYDDDSKGMCLELKGAKRLLFAIGPFNFKTNLFAFGLF